MRNIEKAMSLYCDQPYYPPQEAFAELLADALMLARENGLDPEELTQSAISHYLNMFDDWPPGVAGHPDDYLDKTPCYYDDPRDSYYRYGEV